MLFQGSAAHLRAETLLANSTIPSLFPAKRELLAIEAAQVIEELIQLAKEMRAADRRGEQLGMSEEELAFYDALETNDSAVKVLGEPTLQQIARELVETVRRNVTIDWTLRENVRAQLRVYVKRILRKYGYPPDKQEKATETVLEQAEMLSAAWAVASTGLLTTGDFDARANNWQANHWAWWLASAHLYRVNYRSGGVCSGEVILRPARTAGIGAAGLGVRSCVDGAVRAYGGCGLACLALRRLPPEQVAPRLVPRSARI